MSAVSDILNKTQFTRNIMGVDFVLRNLTAENALVILGPKVLGVVRGAASTKEPSPQDMSTLLVEKAPKILRACMVSPKLGDESDEERDTISFDDLGEFSAGVLGAIFEGSGYEHLENFPKSPEATEEEK